MRILFVSQYYRPETGAGSNRVTRLAQGWSSLGHEVSVLTTFPNYPDGAVYPGYRNRWLQTEELDGVEVVRAPTLMAANRGRWKRSLSYLSFLISVVVFGLRLARRADVVVASSPQLLAGTAGAILAALGRRPFVLDVRDLWPDSIAAVGALSEKSWTFRILRRIELWTNRRAAHIVVVSQAFIERLVERGVAPNRISFFPNTVDSELFHPDPTPTDPVGPNDPWPNRFVACFAGTVGMAHGLETIIDAARISKAEEEYLFLVIGDGAERSKLEQLAREEELDNIVFTGRIPRPAVAGYLRRADVSLVLLRDDPLFRTVIPSKMLESMGCATPIILGVDGEARALLEEAGAGLFVPPADAQAVVSAIRRLAMDRDAREAQGRAGLEHVNRHFVREVVTAQYLELLELLLAKPGVEVFAPDVR